MASGTTTISSLPYPLTTDAPNVSSDIEALANALDGKAVPSSGTLSGRPSAGTFGHVYYATDKGIVYYDNGTVWLAVMLAGAWTTLTIPSGFTTVGGAPSPRWQQAGNRIFLDGAFQSTSGFTTSATFSSLPAPTNGWTQSTNLQGTTTDIIQCRMTASATTMEAAAFSTSGVEASLSALSYPLD